MWAVVSLCVVIYASYITIASAYDIEVLAVPTEQFHKDGVKHKRVRLTLIPSRPGETSDELHYGQLQHPYGFVPQAKSSYHNFDYYPYQRRNEKSQKVYTRMPSILDNFPDPDSNEADGNSLTPPSQEITHEAATGPDPGTSEYFCSISHQNAQKGIDTRKNLRSTQEAEVSPPPSQEISHEAATGPDPDTPEYISSHQNAQHRINKRMIQHNIINHNHNKHLKSLYLPHVNNAHKHYLKHQSFPIHHKYFYGFAPHASSIYRHFGYHPHLKSSGKCLWCGSEHKNLQNVIYTRIPSILDAAPDPGTQEAGGKAFTPPAQEITHEAATGPDPGTSEYISSILHQNGQKGINTRMTWRQHNIINHDHNKRLKSVYSPHENQAHEEYLAHVKEFQGQHFPTKYRYLYGLIPQAKSIYHIGYYPYNKSASHKNSQNVIYTKIPSILDSAPDPGTQEAGETAFTSSAQEITHEAATGPDPSTSEYISSILHQNAQHGINTKMIPSLHNVINNGHNKYLKKNYSPHVKHYHQKYFYGIIPQTKSSHHNFHYYPHHKSSGKCPCDSEHKNVIYTSIPFLLDSAPDPGTQEVGGKAFTPLAQEITHEAATGPDSATSEYISSISHQNAQQGIDMRTIIDAILKAAHDPGSSEYEIYNDELVPT